MNNFNYTNAYGTSAPAVTQANNTCRTFDISNRNNTNATNSTHTTHKQRTKVYSPVEPIKSKDDIQLAKEYLLSNNTSTTQFRDYTMFVLMINFGKRIGDVLNLTVSDVLNGKGQLRNSFWIVTEKTNHKEEIFLNDSVKQILTLYFSKNPKLLDNPDNGLFPTRESKGKSMTYDRAYQIFKNIEKAINATKSENEKVRLATHSARKTTAYQYVMSHRDDSYAIAKVSKALGHKSIDATMHYLGLDRKELKDFYSQEL